MLLMQCPIRLEIENARLEAAAKQQSNKLEALQKGAQEGAMVSAANRIQSPAHMLQTQALSGAMLAFF